MRINTALSTAQWDSAVTGAVNVWAQSKVLSLTQQAASSVNTKKCSSITGQILVCNASYGQRGWLGIASISITGGTHITSGTTKLNDSYFDTAQYNTAAWRSLVACQEIGHDFGLDHQDTNFNNANLGTCMDYTNAPSGGTLNGFNYGPSNEHPNTHDYDELVTIYTHLDSSSTTIPQTNFGIRQVGKAVPRSASFEPGDSPAEWGRAIHADRQGRPDVFVRDLGGGHNVLTHVFWAIGEGPRN